LSAQLSNYRMVNVMYLFLIKQLQEEI